MLLQVHDELLLEGPEAELRRIAPTLCRLMESAYELRARLHVDLKMGKNWEDMQLLDSGGEGIAESRKRDEWERAEEESLADSLTPPLSVGACLSFPKSSRFVATSPGRSSAAPLPLWSSGCQSCSSRYATSRSRGC